MQIVSPQDFPFAWWIGVGNQVRGPGNPKTKSKIVYKDIVTAFDIETTRLEDIEQSVMYVWQWCFADAYTVVGRTWEEFVEFYNGLRRSMKDNEYVVCFVHNLSFEFEYLRGIFSFETDNVFAVKPRKILKAIIANLEFRCSYLHSNMSLDEYLNKMGVAHRKLELDYSKRRFSWTQLTPDEIAYCVNDVQGLVEAITVEMDHDADNLYTLPLTSTGYVRRDIKRAMRDVSHNYIQGQLPDWEIFSMLRDAFRGGDCHANRFFTGQIVHCGHSADRSSSYPDIVCNCKFPISKFFKLKKSPSVDEVLHLIDSGKALIMKVAFTNIELADPFWPMPYLSRDKCDNIMHGEYDNGRILSADYLETTITDVDLKIILKEYTATDIVFISAAYARYGKLPLPLVRETIKYYRAKTELKGVEGQEVYYTKSKNKLNAIYGMMAQDPSKLKILYQQDGIVGENGEIQYYIDDDSKTKEQVLEESNRRAFEAYQWGVWVTAWARYRLHEAMWVISEQGGELLYCDTDSTKYLGFVDWTEYNRQRIADSIASGAYADDPAGNRHYMGVMEQEDDFSAFRTWGAKKYAYIVQKRGRPWLVLTLAGVAKKLGAHELIKAGVLAEKKRLGRNLRRAEIKDRGAELGLQMFDIGFEFLEAGGLEAVYNDAPLMTYQDPETGKHITITSNLNLRPSSYTLGLSSDYERLWRQVKYFGIDF